MVGTLLSVEEHHDEDDLGDGGSIYVWPLMVEANWATSWTPRLLYQAHA